MSETAKRRLLEILKSNRDDRLALALAYLEGRAIEAAQTRERKIRKSGNPTMYVESERRADMAFVLDAMIGELRAAQLFLESADD